MLSGNLTWLRLYLRILATVLSVPFQLHPCKPMALPLWCWWQITSWSSASWHGLGATCTMPPCLEASSLGNLAECRWQSHFCFLYIHLMQPSNPWYWLLGLLAGGATWPEGFALALAAAGLLKPWLWHWLASSARCFHSCGLCLCLGHDFPANSETLETESKFSERLKSNPVFFFCFRDFGGNWLVGLEKPTGNLM